LSRLIGGTIRRVKSDCVVVEGAEKKSLFGKVFVMLWEGKFLAVEWNN